MSWQGFNKCPCLFSGIQIHALQIKVDAHVLIDGNCLNKVWKSFNGRMLVLLENDILEYLEPLIQFIFVFEKNRIRFQILQKKNERKKRKKFLKFTCSLFFSLNFLHEITKLMFSCNVTVQFVNRK